MANGVDHLDHLMGMLMRCGLFLVILDDDEVCAVWRTSFRDYGSFDVTRAFATGHDLGLALMNGLAILRRFTIRTPHVMGCFAGDTLNVDDKMASQIANDLHDMIEDGVLVGQEIVAL